MKVREMKTIAEQDLKSTLVDLKKELIKINTQVSTGASPENPGRAKQVKKSIARIFTRLNQKPTGGKTKA